MLAGVMLAACPKEENGQKFEAYFSEPHCPDYNYSKEITQNNGEKRLTKFGNAYCTKSDFLDPAREKTMIDQPLRDIMNDPAFKLEQMDIASYLFYLDDFSQMVCERAKHDDFNVRFITQRPSKNMIRDYVGKDTMKRLKACLGKRLQVTEVGCDVFFDTCPESVINTMHTKLISLRGTRNGKPVALFFGGSGNIAEKLRNNFDNVDFMQVPQGSPLDVEHRCMVDTMAAAGHHPWVLEKIKETYRQCTEHMANDDKPPAVDAYFLPAERNRYLKKLITGIHSATEIKAAVQVLADQNICIALAHAVKRGAKVRFLTDNIEYLNNFLPDKAILADASDCSKFYKTDARFRFLETNSDFTDISGNTLHLRYFIINGKNGSTVFTGSSHIKSGAFSKNYENQYIITDPHLVGQYNDNFDALWDRALPPQQMPNAYVISTYAKEHQESFILPDAN